MAICNECGQDKEPHLVSGPDVYRTECKEELHLSSCWKCGTIMNIHDLVDVGGTRMCHDCKVADTNSLYHFFIQVVWAANTKYTTNECF